MRTKGVTTATMPKKPPPTDEDNRDDEEMDEEEDPYRDMIMGVDAPTIDLEQVGISRGLAMVLGPEGTRNVVLGAMLRGIGRELHPDISTIEGAAETFATINSTITAIGRLNDKQWQEVHRRFVTRRDDVMSRLLAAEESALSLRGTVSDQRDLIKELELKLAEKHARVTDPAAFDAIFSLFFSGVSRPTRPLREEGDDKLNVSELQSCVVVCSGSVHYVARGGRVSTGLFTIGSVMDDLQTLILRGRRMDMEVDLEAIAGDDEIAVELEAGKFLRHEGDRGIFAPEDGIFPPRVIVGAYSGDEVAEETREVIPLEKCPQVLKQCHPEIGTESRLLIATPAISGRNLPTGIEFQNYGPISSIFGPYKIIKTRVTGPHIKEEK